MSVQRVCVIGCGASGLTSIKCCLEEKFDVICYERGARLGGLWNYEESGQAVKSVAHEGHASVMFNTCANNSKDMSAFSDFPPPIEYSNYMHNTAMVSRPKFNQLIMFGFN